MRPKVREFAFYAHLARYMHLIAISILFEVDTAVGQNEIVHFSSINVVL
jgi:hypothetical protein